MFDKPIQDILTARLQQLPEMVLETSLAHDIDELVKKHLPTGTLAVVDDYNTSRTLGEAVFRGLKGRYQASHITLSHGAKADEAALHDIESKSKGADLLVAVGAGTINDLVKYASHKAGIPYIIFPTAASMNGYVSATASLALDGHKQSYAAHLPAAVFIDMSTLMNAPTPLAQAGIGDSLARPTAQADWLLSHHLLGTAYDETPYTLVRHFEDIVFDHAQAIFRKDREATEILLKLLLLSGFGMTIAGSSIPASGAEHMLAHSMASEGSLNNLHGEEIAVTSVDMARRQADLLTKSRVRFCPLEDHANEGYKKKRALIMQRFADGTIPKEVWERAREAMEAVHIAPDRLQHIRAEAGLPDSPENLGWDKKYYQETLPMVRFTRDRFTCLDIE